MSCPVLSNKHGIRTYIEYDIIVVTNGIVSLSPPPHIYVTCIVQAVNAGNLLYGEDLIEVNKNLSSVQIYNGDIVYTALNATGIDLHAQIV